MNADVSGGKSSFWPFDGDAGDREDEEREGKRARVDPTAYTTNGLGTSPNNETEAAAAATACWLGAGNASEAAAHGQPHADSGPSCVDISGQQQSSDAGVKHEAEKLQGGILNFNIPPPAAAALDDASVGAGDEVTPSDLKITPGAYTQREEYLLKQEQEGEIGFCYVENDGTAQNMIHLTGLKIIFSKQLPNMPKEYICRLVYDRRHKSAALCKRNGQVIGGITYRAFHQQGFGEIAFCAVTSSEQVKGFGTRLMNYAKEFARTRDHLTYFLTYADNAAVGYFAKQGFTKEVTMERERWHGFIKEYDGGTLMECAINPKICYTQFPSMIRTQRCALDLKIRSISSAHVVRKALPYFRQQPSQEEREAAAGGREQGQGGRVMRPPLDIALIPGVKEARWTPEQAEAGRSRVLLVLNKSDAAVEPSPEHLQRFMTQACRELRGNEDSWPFHDPVPLDEVPDYAVIIPDPIDLSLIEQRLRSRSYYLTLDIFTADMRRMFNNCRTYNNSETIYYKLSNKLEAAFNNFMSAHVITDPNVTAAASTPSQAA